MLRRRPKRKPLPRPLYLPRLQSISAPGSPKTPLTKAVLRVLKTPYVTPADNSVMKKILIQVPSGSQKDVAEKLIQVHDTDVGTWQKIKRYISGNVAPIAVAGVAIGLVLASLNKRSLHTAHDLIQPAVQKAAETIAHTKRRSPSPTSKSFWDLLKDSFGNAMKEYTAVIASKRHACCQHKCRGAFGTSPRPGLMYNICCENRCGAGKFFFPKTP